MTEINQGFGAAISELQHIMGEYEDMQIKTFYIFSVHKAHFQHLSLKKTTTQTHAILNNSDFTKNTLLTLFSASGHNLRTQALEHS